MTTRSRQPRMTAIPVEQAVGSVLCHDITRIVPGEFKGPAFRKGHRITAEDVSELLKMGKEHIYVLEPQEGFLHEEEAAARLAKAAEGPNLLFSQPKEGRINIMAAAPGLLRINVDLLNRINSLGEITFATKRTLREVAKGEALGGVRVVPLMVDERIVARAEELCAADAAPLLSVLPYRKARVGMVVTGSEIYHGRIEDAFGPVLRKKFAALGSEILGEKRTSDDRERTKEAILSFADAGADMVVLTGGMSVDPDDQTPASIRATGARVVTYGAPVFPGAMFMLAFLDGPRGPIPVLGLPGCVMYHRASIFDLIVPRLLAGLEVTREDILGMGHGGFCAGCPECHYPNCTYGV